MSKKSFKSSFDNVLLGENEKRGAPQIKRQYKPQEQKATFLVRCDQLDKIKAISYFERKMLKDILAEALEHYITDYEKTNGAVQLPRS